MPLLLSLRLDMFCSDFLSSNSAFYGQPVFGFGLCVHACSKKILYLCSDLEHAPLAIID